MRPTICMCTYSRPDNFFPILDSLEAQLHKEFDFLVWDNTEEGKLLSLDYHYSPVPYMILGDNKNFGSVARFYLPHYSAGDPIIFIDDDQFPHADFVQYCLEVYEKEPLALHSAHTRIFKEECYWDNTVPGKPGEEVDYCGTGGMVAPAAFMQHIMPELVPDFCKVTEDLWLCHIAKKFNLKLKAMECKLTTINDGKDQMHAIWPEKERCFRFLRKGLGMPILKERQDGEESNNNGSQFAEPAH